MLQESVDKGVQAIVDVTSTVSQYRTGTFKDKPRCGHDNNKPPPIAKRTPESERGPFSDPETTLRTIRKGTFKITFSTMNIGETRQNPKKKCSILIHQGRSE